MADRETNELPGGSGIFIIPVRDEAVPVRDEAAGTADMGTKRAFER